MDCKPQPGKASRDDTDSETLLRAYEYETLEDIVEYEIPISVSGNQAAGGGMSNSKNQE